MKRVLKKIHPAAVAGIGATLIFFSTAVSLLYIPQLAESIDQQQTLITKLNLELEKKQNLHWEGDGSAATANMLVGLIIATGEKKGQNFLFEQAALYSYRSLISMKNASENIAKNRSTDLTPVLLKNRVRKGGKDALEAFKELEKAILVARTDSTKYLENLPRKIWREEQTVALLRDEKSQLRMLLGMVNLFGFVIAMCKDFFGL